jgi:hypothetical protein
MRLYILSNFTLGIAALNGDELGARLHLEHRLLLAQPTLFRGGATPYEPQRNNATTETTETIRTLRADHLSDKGQPFAKIDNLCMIDDLFMLNMLLQKTSIYRATPVPRQNGPESAT